MESLIRKYRAQVYFAGAPSPPTALHLLRPFASSFCPRGGRLPPTAGLGPHPSEVAIAARQGGASDNGATSCVLKWRVLPAGHDHDLEHLHYQSSSFYKPNYHTIVSGEAVLLQGAG